MNGEQLIRSFISIYGPDQGRRIFMNVMPGILADFNKMLREVRTGETVSEEYILEDRKAALHLTGRLTKGETEITADLRKL